jgi:hypothetical protein
MVLLGLFFVTNYVIVTLYIAENVIATTFYYLYLEWQTILINYFNIIMEYCHSTLYPKLEQNSFVFFIAKDPPHKL